MSPSLASARSATAAPPTAARLRSAKGRAPIALRLPLLAAAMASLVLGLVGGLVRLDVALPEPAANLALVHGPLMIVGFLGTVVSLERAVALGGSAFAAPLLAAAAVAALLAGASTTLAPMLAVAASVALAAVLARLLARDPALHAAVLVASALSWTVGNALWAAGWPVFRVVPWWVAFLVLMIAGERLELTRLQRRRPGQHATFAAAAGVLLAGLATSLFAADAGPRLAGAGMVLLAAWLARHDVALRTVRERGLARFMAVCLLAGYAWLAVAGVLWAALGAPASGMLRDAALHAVFLGFVFGMIFAHAPVIFPSVLGTRMVYSPAFYGHVIALQATLTARVAGDLLLWRAAQEWSGLGNALAILLFVAATATAVVRGRIGDAGRRNT
ncbi:MAG TPA: hypothetical protein VFD92_10850 [Candidatus Binatia bacterium]|nr:hypothetical protein [Candidatus Binatia bacterium]